MYTTLTAQDVDYWKRNLSRILKIGAEFEFNLPDKATGTCKGKSFTCPCVKYGSEEHDCWTRCLNDSMCSSVPHTSRCENYNEACSVKKCGDCKDYKFKCIGITCSNIVAQCVNCDEFELDCKSCEHRFDPNKNPDAIRQSCVNTFKPSGSYGVVADSGVHNITTDGSLLGKKGMEIITTGRRVDYWEFYEMTKKIIDTAVSRGGYCNERCSVHMHGLASYYGKVPGSGSSSRISELERSVPEIVLANLHQLFRRYQNAITWMTSGLDDPNHLTRWEKFRVSLLPVSAIGKNMREVTEEVQRVSGGTKYGWANYKFCSFDHNGDVDRLHVEVRVMDGLLAPSAVSAFACLYYALFIKAIELSRYGVIRMGNDERCAIAHKVKDALMNNCSDWQEGNKYGRFSNTEKVHKYTEVLVAESFELIAQLKHILASVGPAYEVLEKMAEMPCSIRRCEGQSWEDIENALKIELTEEGQFEYHVKRLIDTRDIINKSTPAEWVEAVAENLHRIKELNPNGNSVDEMKDKVAIHVEDRQADGEMIWAGRIGSMINI